MTWVPDDNRYDGRMPYRRLGRWGLHLPAISLGLWQNFGGQAPLGKQRDILRRAFDLGINHFDLANNYGPPPGSSEEAFGEILATDFAGYRDELVISSKAGWKMWDGPHQFGGSRKYLLSSLDASLKRMKLDYVDIFYHHRPDPDTPLDETMGALHQAVTSGKALYVGISSYSASATAEMAAIAKDLGTPLVIHQPSYSIANRWVEEGEPNLLKACADDGLGVIAFSPLGQGLLTNKYLNGIPDDSRVRRGAALAEDVINEANVEMARKLNGIAESRGQSLAQMAIAWVLREQDNPVTSALIGASSVEQLEDSLGALKNLEFTDSELSDIDGLARDAGVNNWAGATKSRA